MPKLLLVSLYVGVSAFMFLVHGRVPDRINVADGLKNKDVFGQIVALTCSLVGVGLWLSWLVSRAVSPAHPNPAPALIPARTPPLPWHTPNSQPKPWPELTPSPRPNRTPA